MPAALRPATLRDGNGTDFLLSIEAGAHRSP